MFVLCGLAIWLHRSAAATRFHFVSMVLGYTINYAFFAAMPTTIARPPLPESGSMWLWAMRLTWAIDAPHTCFPSLHITNCTAAVCAYGRGRPRAALVFALWTLVIAASTLTSRQHYFWDLPAGAAVGAAGHLLALVLVRDRATSSPRPPCPQAVIPLSRRRGSSSP